MQTVKKGDAYMAAGWGVVLPNGFNPVKLQ